MPTCLEWALRRDRPVPEAVIREFHAAINHRQFGPCRAEGLAALASPRPVKEAKEVEGTDAPADEPSDTDTPTAAVPGVD